jgi:hypothetical protein
MASRPDDARHSYSNFTGASGDEEDGYWPFRTDRLNRCDSAARPKFDVGRNQVGALASGRHDRLLGGDGNIERSEAAIAQGFLYRHGDQGFIFNYECMHYSAP